MKDEKIKAIGIVIKALPNLKFKVELEDSNHIIMAYLSGKLQQKNIRILEGDKVTVEISPYDLNKGRIIYRGELK